MKIKNELFEVKNDGSPNDFYTIMLEINKKDLPIDASFKFIEFWDKYNELKKRFDTAKNEMFQKYGTVQPNGMIQVKTLFSLVQEKLKEQIDAIIKEFNDTKDNYTGDALLQKQFEADSKINTLMYDEINKLRLEQPEETQKIENNYNEFTKAREALLELEQDIEFEKIKLPTTISISPEKLRVIQDFVTN